MQKQDVPTLQKKPSPFEVLASHSRYLEAIAQLHYLQAGQVNRLFHKKGTVKLVKARLKALTDNGYLQSFCRPTLQAKSPYIYTLARKGINYLSEVGMDVNRYFRPSDHKNGHAYEFLLHTLELNDVLIAAMLLHKDAPHIDLVAFRHDYAFKRTPFQVTVSRNGKQESIILIPDGWLDFRIVLAGKPKKRRLCIWLEHDRGKHEAGRFKQKIRGIFHFIESGNYKETFGTASVTVAFTTSAGEKRVAQMKQWVEQELEGQFGTNAKAYADWFAFAALPHELDPKTLFLSPVFSQPFANQPVPLLYTTH